MKKTLALMLGLVASAASFANAQVDAPTTEPIQSQVSVTTDHKVKLTVAAIPSRAKIEMKDESGRALYSQYVPLKTGLSQKFDISALASGTYQLTIAADGQLVTKTFVIENVPAQTRINVAI